MFKKATPLILICETPLHAGSGSELGIVDLPIQRERHTGFPKVEGSSLKGCIREAFEKPNEKQNEMKLINVGAKAVTSNPINKEYQKTVELTFGPENAGDDNHAGALGFTDARLLLFPVRSVKEVFAWITCPKVIQRFENDLRLCGLNPGFSVPESMTMPHDSLLLTNDSVILEEYAFKVKKEASAEGACTQFAGWLSENIFPKPGKDSTDVYAYWRDKIRRDIVVLNNDDFRDFVSLGTEVITRIKIDNNTGTVAQGALFTEEYLPAESILYSLAMSTPIFKKNQADKGIFNQEENDLFEAGLVMEFFKNGLGSMIQLGGDATIGKGLIRPNVMEVTDA